MPFTCVRTGAPVIIGCDPPIASAAAGKIWSARFEGVKPQPASIAAGIEIEAARPEDLPTIRALLAEGGLPTDAEPHLRDFLVARHQGRVVGCVGMEGCGPDALFRSLVVASPYRGSGLGRRLYEAQVEYARARGIRRAYLLTTTIASLAEAWGFKPIERPQVPASIQQTSQFQGACCTSAVAMWREL